MQKTSKYTYEKYILFFVVKLFYSFIFYIHQPRAITQAVSVAFSSCVFVYNRFNLLFYEIRYSRFLSEIK